MYTLRLLTVAYAYAYGDLYPKFTRHVLDFHACDDLCVCVSTAAE